MTHNIWLLVDITKRSVNHNIDGRMAAWDIEQDQVSRCIGWTLRGIRAINYTIKTNIVQLY